jgi:hypothetical protein
VVLRKVFTRTRLHVPFFLHRDRLGQVAGTAQSGGCLAALLSAVSAPVPFAAGPAWAVVPVGLLLAWLAGDRRMYGAAIRGHGAGFGTFFVAMHYLVTLTTAAGLLVGMAQWVNSRSFRRLYDVPAEPGPVAR